MSAWGEGREGEREGGRASRGGGRESERPSLHFLVVVVVGALPSSCEPEGRGGRMGGGEGGREGGRVALAS